MAVGASPNLKQRTLLVAGMAIGIVAVMVVGQIWQTYDSSVAAARRDVQQFTQIIEANTDITFQSVTLVLDRAIDATRARQGVAVPDGIMAERFINMADNWALINSVIFIDAAGVGHGGVVRGGDDRLHPIGDTLDAAQHPIYLFHRGANAETRAFFITRPQRDLVSDRRIIGVTRALTDEKGAFGGVYIVTIALDAFTMVYADLLPSRYEAVDLIRRDGALLASTNPARARELTENEKLLIKEMVPAARAGVYRVTTGENYSGDLLSYRALQRYPIVIAVTADWYQFTEKWREASLALIASALSGALVICALTWWLIRRIAAEQATKHALQMNELRILESQRLSGIGYYEDTIPSTNLRWSPNMFAIHGLDPKTFRPGQDTFIHLVVPEDQQRIVKQWAAFADKPEPGSVECRITRPDGEVRHIRYNHQVMEDRRIFGVAQDVTAIRTAEDTIRDDEERLRDIVECSSDYIWELGANGAITLFSGAATNRFGDGMGAGLRILTGDAPDADGGDFALLQRAIKLRTQFRSLLLPIKNAEGQLRWVRLSGNPRFDAAGRYLGYRGAGTDVTELNNKQERDEADRKAEALGRLAGGMAHEINNLLQPIVIYANLGNAQSDPAAGVRQYFARIGIAAERSMTIVRNVLAFARQSPPKRENVSVLDVVRETVDLIGGTLDPRTTLVINDSLDDLVVRVDRTGLTQLLTNLVTNAAEASPAGARIAVTIDAANFEAGAARALSLAPGLYCRLLVEDNGPGIPVDQLGKVFDPFFTTKSQGKGTGLGLSVVSGLAKSWGGTVTVESAVGTGTCFTVYLPVAEAQLQAAQ